MRSIYKYDVLKLSEKNEGATVIEGPITKILTVQVQHDSIMVWAEVDTEMPNRKFEVAAIGTGWPLDANNCVLDTHDYLGTLQFMEGHLVLHIYIKELIPTTVKNKPVKTNKGELKVEFKPNEATFTSVAMINPEVLAKLIQ